MNKRIGFSFETVMSHTSKVDFLKLANATGFKTYLYFIATVDPKIHKDRVNERVQKGGHGVPENKIEERYYRSLSNLYPAIKAANRAFVIDNSNMSNNLIAEKTNDNQLYLHVSSVPWWFNDYVLSNLNT